MRRRGRRGLIEGKGERERMKGEGDGTAGLDGLLTAGSELIRDYEG